MNVLRRARPVRHEPELPPQRGSGFSERRYTKPKKLCGRLGYNARDRVTRGVLVILERKDGLAVKRPDHGRAPPPTVSRHGFSADVERLAGLLIQFLPPPSVRPIMRRRQRAFAGTMVDASSG